MVPRTWFAAILLLVCPCAFVSADIVAHWRFEPGNLQADSAGSHTLSNSGVVSSLDTPGFAVSSGSASFNGNQATFQTAQPINLSLFSDLTIEYFIKTTHTQLAIVFEHAPPANTNTPGSVGSAINDLANEVEVYQRGTAGTYLDETTLPILDGEWHHVAMTFDGSETGADRLKLYVDGSEVGVDNNFAPTGTPAFLNEVLYIGSRSNTTLKYTGLLDELRISDTILSPDEFLIVAIPEPASVFLLLTASAVGFALCFGKRLLTNA